MSYIDEGEAKRLDQLAGNDQTRLRVLSDRRMRSGVRSRSLSCPACGIRGYSLRGKDDICAACLIDIWTLQDERAKAEADPTKGFKAYVGPDRAYSLVHPRLSTTITAEIPETATFYRGEKRDAGAMKALFHELFKELGKLSPVPPTISIGRAESVLPGSEYGQFNLVKALIPPEIVQTIRDLWAFIEWQSAQAATDGFDQGSNLLMQLNSGRLTVSNFNDAIAEQTKRLRNTSDRAVKP